ncbi:MAG TPA: hypothetical protein VL307_02405 [Chitinophagaceae bacterium]|nr:hypothetical protein [Chitinophagaceae bacterium]
MDPVKIGRTCYGIGIIAYGLQQLVISDFRPQIVAAFPSWAHQYPVFALLTGVLMIVAGCIIAGFISLAKLPAKKVCLWLAGYFFVLLLASHLPYLLFVYPHKLSHLGSWGDALKGLAFCGGAFVMAGSFPPAGHLFDEGSGWQPQAGLTATLGRIFFCTTIILFGCNHFAYDLSGMVPKWIGHSVFWSYFAGTALVALGTAVLLRIFLLPAGVLLALMLFSWFLLVHIPGAVANPTVGRGNLVVSAFDALLFSGTALVLSQSGHRQRLQAPVIL